MKTKKKHKWKYQINIKKKVLVLVILGVLMFVGIGFGILESNLGILGSLEVSKYDKTLYGALKKEVNKGYALKYTGAHQDSIDSTKSTEDIYYFHADTNEKGTTVQNKNNVVFAGYCWQMIRTTDTGGVKLLYNGLPAVTENNGVTEYDCGTSRNYADISSILYRSDTDLAGTYLYASSYTVTYNSNMTTSIELNDPVSITIDASNADAEIANIVANYPYTCKNTTGTCNLNTYSIYKIASQSTGTKAYGYPATERDNIGTSQFNSNIRSLAYAGYMYGDDYQTQYTTVTKSENFSPNTTTNIYSNTISVNYTFYYSNSIEWNTTNPNQYTLVDAQQVPSDVDLDDLVGKYVIKNTTHSASVNYVIGKNHTGTQVYVKTLNSGDTEVAMRFADSVNGNDLVNPTAPIELKDYFAHYTDYAGKYTCGDSTTTCATTPRFILKNTSTTYTYTEPKKFVIAKGRNNLQLTDYTEITIDEWYRGYDTTYEDYYYTCGDTSTTCTAESMRYIYKRQANTYSYPQNRYYGSSYKYEDNKFKLQNVEWIEAIDQDEELVNHHYSCLTAGDTECDSVAYFFGSGRYIIIDDPDIESIDDVIDAMLKKNTHDSTVKANIDSWYEKNIKDTIYESKIEETIYCNDRSFSTDEGKTFAESGWNANGGSIKNNIYFNVYKNIPNDNPTTDLSCTNVTDRFSISNNDAKLKYSIGLPTTSEMNLLGNNNARKMVSYYYIWLATPILYENAGEYMHIWNVTREGEITYVDGADRYNPTRPMISLVKDTKYSQGNGSTTNPYVVDMSE